MGTARAEIVVDLAAIRHNVRAAQGARRHGDDDRGQGRRLRPRARRGRRGRPARPAPSGSASRPSTRRSRCAPAGDTGRVLCWLTVPGEDWRPRPSTRDIDVTGYSEAELDEVAATARRGRPRPAQGRHRAQPRRRAASTRVAAVCSRAPRAACERASWIRVTGIWSHFASSDEPDDPANDAQEAALPRGRRRRRRRRARARGPPPGQLRRRDPAAQLAARPGPVRHRVVRPRPGARRHARSSGWCPAMTARADLAMVKHVDAGAAVSYGRTWTADRGDHARPGPGRVRRRAAARRAATAPRSGSAAGAARSAAGSAWTSSSSTSRATTRAPARTPSVFGPGTHGEPTAQDWAEACGTISYEIVTRIGGRFRPPLRRQREDRPMSARGRILGAAAGALGLAAAGTAIGVRRQRRAIDRRTAGRHAVRHACARRPVTVVADDGVPLHVEVDELDPDAAPAGEPADRRLLPRLRAQPRLLALPARGLPRPGPRGLLRPALARPLRPLARRSTPRSTSSAATSRRCSTRSSPTARSCWSATRWAA